MGVSLGAQNLDGRHLWENHGKSTGDGGFSVAMFDDGSLNDVQLVRHAFIVVDDVYSLVKKTIRGKTRNDTMQNLNQLATSRGETERCQGQADKPLKYVVPLESNLLGNFNPGPFGFFQGVLSKAGQPGTIFRYPQNIFPVQGPWRLCTQICSILSRNHVLPPFKSDMNSRI